MEETTVINKTLKANSYEVGPANRRIKLYFEDAEDLQEQIDELKLKNLWVE